MSYKVLIVDDNIINSRLLQAILLPMNYECFILSEPKQIVDKLNEYHPDIILLDLFMPEQDGYQTLQIVKAIPEFKRIPVIIITADTSKESLVRCLDLGAMDYLNKPINETELKARMSSALKLMGLSNQLIEAEKRATYAATIVTTNHTINQPLTAVKGNLELLLAFHNQKLGDDVLKILTRSLNSINEIVEIINKLKDVETPTYISYSGDTMMVDIENKKKKDSNIM